MELHPQYVERQTSDRKPADLEAFSRALQENENWYRDLVDHSQDLLCIHDLQGRLLSVNPAPARVLGYTVDELLKVPMREIIAPEFREQFDAYLTQIAFRREARGLMAVLTRTGERRIWDYHNTLRTEGVLSPIVRGIAHDITDRIRIERELRKREDDLNRAQSVAHIGSWSYDIVRQTVTFSDETYRIIGLPKTSSFTPESATEIVHPDDRARVKECWGAAIRTGHFDLEHRIVVHGNVRWIHAMADMQAAGDGKPIGAVGTIQDVTDRKKALAALEASENRFRVVYESSPVGICLTETSTGRFLQVNPKFCEIVDRLPEDLLSRNVQSITHPDDIAEGIKKSQKVLSGELNRYELEQRYLRPDGSVRRVSVMVTKGRAQHDPVAWNMAIVQDVTELHEMTEQLRRAKEKLAEEKLYLEQEIDSELGFGEIIGQSQALKAVMEQVGHVAASDATVLLLGETGTGKELIARAIHERSTRRRSSFIKVNCAAIPSGLLESELFGHEKGAFTGAVSKKIGRLELADRGTLFLDEIGEVPLSLQPKLLRVLQDQEFERLGGTQTIRVNFRLIAATNRDLSQSMKEKQFRSDLYYRLNVFPVRVPLLRERPEDIPLLVEHFVQRFAGRMNRTITSVPKRTMEMLMEWTWPGNVRELENFIERSVILTHGSVLAAPISELVVPVRRDGSGESLKAKEREHILRALQQTRGQLSGPRGAAARLGLPRSTLQWKLRQFGIDPGQYRD